MAGYTGSGYPGKRFTGSGFDKTETHRKFSDLLNRIVDSYPENSPERGFLFFVWGSAHSIGDSMSHEFVTLNGRTPTQKEIEDYVIRIYHKPISVMLLEDAYERNVTQRSANPPQRLMKLANILFIATVLDEWAYYKLNPMNYSGFMDSIGTYTEDELRRMGFPGWSR